MKIVKLKNKYKVESEHRKGKFYKVDLEKPFCTCPAFMYRELKRHGICKHIKAVQDHVSKKHKTGYDKVLKYLSKGPVDSIKLIKKYGEKIIEELKKRGEVIEERGNIRILK